MTPLDQRITALEQKIQAIDAERVALLQELTRLKQLHPLQANQIQPSTLATVTHQSPIKDKINLFRSLFKGREDVFAKRWVSSKTGKQGYSPVCSNEWQPMLCKKPAIKCSDCRNVALMSVNDQAINNHLAGHGNEQHSSVDFVMGVYPLMTDERCWLLAVDFDKTSWKQDVAAFVSACKNHGIPYSIEKSRSGKGAHIWVFSTAPVFAMDARKLGTFLLTEAMDKHPELGFESYDRLFPNQDTLPKGGFGNLIALPLQKKPREQGNSVFVDDEYVAFSDQWAYLSTVTRMTPIELNQHIESAERQNSLLKVKLPINEEDTEPWKLPPSRAFKEIALSEPLPDCVTIILGNQIFIKTQNLPKALQTKIIRLAAFQNPEFYKKQALRLSTFAIPRIISCAEYFSEHIALPRGCQEDL